MTSISRFFAFALAMSLVASACGGSAAEEATATDASTTDVAAQEESTATPADEPEAASTDEVKSLDDYLGVAANFVRGGGQGGGRGGGGPGGVDDEQRTEEQRQIEQAVQLCMQSQGFEYTPQEAGGGLRFFLATQGQGISPQEFAETQGFGISTRFDALIDGDVDLTEDTNPNDDYVASLSDGEADAYQIALRGQPPVRNDEGQLVDPETGEAVQGGPGRAAGGCRGDAQLEVRGDFSVLAELEDEFVELNERIAADPRIAEINQAWSDCMREAGFAFETEDEARGSISEEFGPLFRSFLTSGAGAGGGQGQGQGQRPGQRLQLTAGLELTAEQELELAQLQDRERALAVKSFECTGGTDNEVEEITARYEAEFVEVNRDVLERVTS